MTPVLCLLLALCISSPIAHATTTFSESKNVCSGHRVTAPPSNWLALNHRQGPCSPFPSPERRIPSTTSEDVLNRDRLRADGIIRRRKHRGGRDEVEATVPTTLGSSLNTMEYVVTVGLGTPAVNQTVPIDTGSDISWVQCRRCPVPPCHAQKDALFDPGKSSTYSAIPCTSVSCLGDLNNDNNNYNGCSASGRRCQYVLEYGDGSNTTGTYSTDKLTLTPALAVDGFRFGCSHAAQMFGTDLADGLLGLGGGKPSLVSQMKEKAFSYCLPPSPSYSGFLTLGTPRISSSGFQVTPMSSRSDVADTHYHVLLQGIAVAGKRLPVAPSVFAAGAVMDSGTVITLLPDTAYRALRTAFRKEMRMRGYQRATASSKMFDTCYNLSSGVQDIKVPSVALVFDGGATVELDRSGIIVDNNGNGCLAFISNKDDSSLGIIGNVQQRTIEVLYDIGGGTVGFRPGAC